MKTMFLYSFAWLLSSSSSIHESSKSKRSKLRHEKSVQLLHIETHGRQRSHLYSQLQPIPWCLEIMQNLMFMSKVFNKSQASTGSLFCLLNPAKGRLVMSKRRCSLTSEIAPIKQEARSRPTMMMHTSRFPTRCLEKQASPSRR